MREGWIEYKFKDVATAVKGKLPKTKNELGIGIPYLTANYLRSGKPDYWIQNLEGAVLAEDGDCLILWDGAGAGDQFTASRGVVSSTMAVVTTQNSKISREFLTLLISSKAEYIKETCRGTTVPHVSPDAIADMALKIPPLLEQKRIVDLISSADSYIEALQQQLERAKKTREAVLHGLLTAGGDDWVETTLGEVALLNPSDPALSNTAHFAPMDAVHVGKRWIQYTEERRDRSGARARAGDVLFARITPCLENGKVAQVQSELERCGGSTEFIVVRGTEKCTSDFLYFWCTLKVNRVKAAELMTGTTGRQRLSWQGLGSLSLLLPSKDEQEKIVNNISEFDLFIESTENAITESKNLRLGLLSDLLSGEHEIPASYDKVMGSAR